MFWWIVRIALWALAGFIANSLMKSGRGGLLWNIIMGLVGGAAGSLVARLIGIQDSNTLGQILISVGGACLVIALVRLLLPKFRK